MSYEEEKAPDTLLREIEGRHEHAAIPQAPEGFTRWHVLLDEFQQADFLSLGIQEILLPERWVTERLTVSDPALVEGFGEGGHLWYSEGKNHRKEEGCIVRESWEPEILVTVIDLEGVKGLLAFVSEVGRLGGYVEIYPGTDHPYPMLCIQSA